MPELFGSSLAGVAVALLGVLIAVLLVLRYRSLIRRGTPLPPGAGGVRLRGLEVRVRRAHEPGVAAGVVHVLGDDWSIADDVDVALAVGTKVRVVAVVGTRLVVAPVEPAAAGPAEDDQPDEKRTLDPPTDPADPAQEPSGTVPPETGSTT